MIISSPGRKIEFSMKYTNTFHLLKLLKHCNMKPALLLCSMHEIGKTLKLTNPETFETLKLLTLISPSKL
jgi:hypothetical protein